MKGIRNNLMAGLAFLAIAIGNIAMAVINSQELSENKLGFSVNLILGIVTAIGAVLFIREHRRKTAKPIPPQ